MIGNHIRPELKCNPPCFGCLDSDPDHCTACWGRGTGEAPQAFLYLQPENGKQTCKDQCNSGFSVNGNAITTLDKRGDVIPSKTYYFCQGCDPVCKECRGQLDGATSKADDVKKCLTCGFQFKFYVEEQETCLIECTAGYYEEFVGININERLQSKCGVCVGSPDVNCKTCQQCDPKDSKNCKKKCVKGQNPATDNCVKQQEHAGASFCTSCKRDAFFPAPLDEIDSLEQYFSTQASMASGALVKLTAAQRAYLDANMNPRDKRFAIKNFLDRSVYELPDKNNTVAAGPVTETGLVVAVPEAVVKITPKTTYKQLYQA